MKLKVFFLCLQNYVRHSQDASGMIKSVNIDFMFMKEASIALGNLHFGWVPLAVNYYPLVMAQGRKLSYQ